MGRVSVLMPVYKTREDYLRAAIESILNQSFKDFEFLILDDCPEDVREAVVKSYDDERIRYIKNEKNLGISASRNKLLDLARGEYLAIFDHDDVSFPERLEEEVKYLDGHPEVGVVGSFSKRLPDGKIVSRPQDDASIKSYLMFGCAVLHTTAMIRKSVLGATRYDARFSPAEDYSLWLDLMQKTSFHNIASPLVGYREYASNTTHAQSDKMSQVRNLCQEKARNENPSLWAHVQDAAIYTVRIKLFNVIPLFKYAQRGMNVATILKMMPFLSVKTKFLSQ